MKKPPQKLERTFRIERAEGDDGKIQLAFASEAPVERWFGNEVLECSVDAVDLSRLNNGGALLLNHDVADQIGVVDSATVDKDGFCRAGVRFSKSAAAQEVYQDVKDGIRRLVSVGYAVNKWVRVPPTGEGQPDTWRAVSWTPYEVSIVSIPADASVGIGRSLVKPKKGKRDEEAEKKDEDDTTDDDSREDDESTDDAGETEDDARAGDDEGTDDTTESDESDDESRDDDSDESDDDKNPDGQGEKSLPKAGKTTRNKPTITMSQTHNAAANPAELEKARIREINAIGVRFGVDAETTAKYIGEGKSIPDFQRHVLDLQEKRTKESRVTSIGMNDAEVKKFSVVRAMHLLAERKQLDGLEKEASDAMAKHLGRDAKGFFIPIDVMHRARRDLSSGAPTGGGNTVETMVDGANLIELLRNKMVTTSLGVRQLSGIKGNLAIPSQTGGATAQWLTEAQLGTSSAQTFGQIVLSPKHLQGSTAFSKQLLAQSSVDVEAFVRDDLMTVLALAKDLAVLGGTGSGGQPTGIAYTSGIGSVTFGAAANYAKIQAFETAVENANALLGKCAYVTTPNTKAKLKGVNRFANTFSPLWADDNTVNGYTALSTKQMSSINSISDGVMFGNFSDAIVADWDGFDVVVDPYSLSLNNQVRIVLHHMTDIGVRHAGSFAMSTDSGAQ